MVGDSYIQTWQDQLFLNAFLKFIPPNQQAWLILSDFPTRMILHLWDFRLIWQSLHNMICKSHSPAKLIKFTTVVAAFIFWLLHHSTCILHTILASGCFCDCERGTKFKVSMVTEISGAWHTSLIRSLNPLVSYLYLETCRIVRIVKGCFTSALQLLLSY